jgi:hypothetical protein
MADPAFARTGLFYATGCMAMLNHAFGLWQCYSKKSGPCRFYIEFPYQVRVIACVNGS